MRTDGISTRRRTAVRVTGLFTILATLVTAMMLAVPAAQAQPQVGEPAPDFRLQDQQGQWRTLADYRGQWVALYFYPKAGTPGCTTEACEFRDNVFAFEEIGATIVGVSVDDVEAQKKFSDEYSLPFALLADVDGEVAKAYGVLRKIMLMSLASRQSFLIDPEGRIVRHYAKVDPKTHSQEVLADLRMLVGEKGASVAR